MADLISDRLLRRALLGIALTGLTLGTLCWLSGNGTCAGRLLGRRNHPSRGWPCRVNGTRSAGRATGGRCCRLRLHVGCACCLGEPLAGAVVAVMYAGGNLLEDFAVARAERDLKSLVDRAPRVAHRRIDTSIEDVPIDQVAIGDTILVRAGEVIPVDGVILGANATLDEAALTGEPIPVTRSKGDPVHSGTINAGETFELRAQRQCRRKYLCGHRAHGDCRADGESALHSPCRSLRAAPAARDAGAGRSGLASVGRPDPRTRRAGGGNTVSADPGGARGFHRRGLSCRTPRHPDQGRAVRSRRSPEPTPSCSTRPGR